MSYYATLDDPQKSGGDVATNLGWNEFGRWVRARKADVEELRHLYAYGWSQELLVLQDDILTAIEEGGDSDVIDIANGLLQMIHDADGAEVIVVTDGAGVAANA